MVDVVELDEAFEATNKKLRRVTTLLGSLMKELENHGVLEKYASPAHAKWWRKHKKEDEASRNLSMLRATAHMKIIAALEELSDEELDAIEMRGVLKNATRQLKKAYKE